MTTTTIHNGRLCNQIIRNLAVSLIAEKQDLYVDYSSSDTIASLGVPLFVGNQRYDATNILNEENYFDLYHSAERITCNVDPNRAYFQTKDVVQLIYNYLHSEPVKNAIIEKNQFNRRYNANNDLFLHVRLSDIAHSNPGSNYYINAINPIDYENLYIATDSSNNAIISEIMDAYPNAQICNYNEVDTIQFGSTCKNVILSHGSFSAVIGYLSFFSNVYYPEDVPGKVWYGELCSIDGWTKLSV